MLLVFSYDIGDFVILSNLRLRSALFLKMLSLLQCVSNTNPNNPVAILRSRWSLHQRLDAFIEKIRQTGEIKKSL
jgi:hypothetical protein